MTAEPVVARTGSRLRKDAARESITRETVTPAPGSTDSEQSESAIKRLFGRGSDEELGTPAPPLALGSMLRVATSVLLSMLALLTVGGAILLLLLWQQNRASGVLTSQLNRTWDLFDLLREIERLIAFLTIPVATAWIVVATINVRRATGRRINPVIAAGSLPVGIFGAWLIGRELVEPASDWFGRGAGFVLQAVFLAVPLLALLRVAQAAEARHRPLRTAYIVSVAYVGALQFLGGLSTVDQTIGADEWGRFGAYLVILALIQVLGALSTNEAARAIEEGTEHRYQLRNRFGESLLSQAELG